MADWYGSARTNYFAVKDRGAFAQALEPFSGLEIVSEDEDDAGRSGRVAVLERHGEGWPSSRYDAQSDDFVEVDFASVLAEHLIAGEIAIIAQVGAEKLRYLTARAVAINSDGDTEVVDLEDIYERARRLGSVITRAEF